MGAKKTEIYRLRNRIFKDYQNYFLNLLYNRFKWSNLPADLEQQYIERILIEDGYGCLVKDDKLGLLFLRANLTNNFNVYGENTSWYAQGFNYNKEYNIDNSILFRNNKTMTPTLHYINLMCDKIVEVEISIYINNYLIRAPYIFKASDKNMLSLKNVMQKIIDGEIAIYTEKNLNIDESMVIDTNADFLINDLNDYKTTLINEVLTRIGINNINIDKKERLTTSEANGNNDFIMNSLYIMLDERKRACKKANELFGTNIDCEINYRGEDNGTIYNNIETNISRQY